MSAPPRGFITHLLPRAVTIALFEQVQSVLEESRPAPADFVPDLLSLAGARGCEKTERAYGRLGEGLNKARRARLVLIDAIREDGFTSERAAEAMISESYQALE